MIGDLFGAATGRRRRRAARLGERGIVVGVRMLPWYVRWLVDRVVARTEVDVYVDGELTKRFSNRAWRPVFVAVDAGETVVTVYGTTQRSAEHRRTRRVQLIPSGPRVLVEQPVVVAERDVVSVSFRRANIGDWPEPSVRRRAAAPVADYRDPA
jgi:hypothetical protein